MTKKTKRSSRKKMQTRSNRYPTSVKGGEVIWESKKNGTYAI